MESRSFFFRGSSKYTWVVKLLTPPHSVYPTKTTVESPKYLHTKIQPDKKMQQKDT